MSVVIGLLVMVAIMGVGGVVGYGLGKRRLPEVVSVPPPVHEVQACLGNLQCFLYILVRDYLSFGEVNKILSEQVFPAKKEYQFSDHIQAEWAMQVAKALLRGEE